MRSGVSRWFLIGHAGLADGLSQFFTPSDKRTSRVSMSSMLTAASAKQPVKQPKLAATGSQAAASRLLKKSKLVQVSAKCGSSVLPPLIYLLPTTAYCLLLSLSCYVCKSYFVCFVLLTIVGKP